MKKIIFVIIILSLAGQNSAQDWQAIRDSINMISYGEHKAMLEMLGIDKLRPGPSGNPNAPNAANADERTAQTYSQLPPIMEFVNGMPVIGASDWPARRKEIKILFDSEVYGKIPDNVPSVDWQVLSVKDTIIGETNAIEKKLSGIVENRQHPELNIAIDLTLIIPAMAKNPVPVIMEFGWNFPFNNRRQQNGPTWKEQLLNEEWGAAVIVPTSYQADHGGGLRQGIIGLVNKGEARKASDWGTLRVWAWGASKAMDYFESDPAVDASRVGIEGLSRYGKAALVTMAYDERFAIALVGSSGAGGAKILRRNFGEQVENLASSAEFHWFCPNFAKYAGPLQVNDLPVDAHQLISLCAPRPVFISVGNPAVEGNWVDARGMFIAAVEAGAAYEVLGKKGLGTTEYPGTGMFLESGDIAFRQHEAGHTVIPNWPYFITFARRYFY